MIYNSSNRNKRKIKRKVKVLLFYFLKQAEKMLSKIKYKQILLDKIKQQMKNFKITKHNIRNLNMKNKLNKMTNNKFSIMSNNSKIII